MARKAYSFGDVAEFTVWVSSAVKLLTKQPFTEASVVKQYKASTGRDISEGVVKRVFTRLNIPLLKRSTKQHPVALLLAREIVTLNEKLHKMAEELGYPDAKDFIPSDVLSSLDDSA